MIKTPGTNLSWQGIEGWLATYHKLYARKASFRRHEQLVAHRKLLTKEIIDDEENTDMLHVLDKASDNFSKIYYADNPTTGGSKWWGEIRCYVHNRIQCLTFPTRRILELMSQTYMTQAFKLLFEAIKEQTEKHGEKVKVNFIKKCLKRVNPKVMTIMNIANDMDWKFLPKPDDAPEKGSDEEAEFIASTKDRYYKQWLERVQKGEFGDEKAEVEETEESNKEVDMVALARAEKAKGAPIEMVNEPEDSRERYEDEEEEEVDELVEAGENRAVAEDVVAAKGQIELLDETKVALFGEVGSNLLRALSDFVSSTDSPPEDTPDLEERVTKLEKKIKGLYNAMRDL